MKLNKTIFNYFIFAIIAFLFNKLYALFAHGVESSWMSNIYLYLLGFGALFFLLLRIFSPNIVLSKNYRLFFNIYNSGIAILINGMLLKGIIEIAGGSSNIIPWFIYIGLSLIIAALVIFSLMMTSRAKEFPKISRNKNYE